MVDAGELFTYALPGPRHVRIEEQEAYSIALVGEMWKAIEGV